MRRFLVLLSRELKAILFSPITYLVATIFLLLCGIYFYFSLRFLVELRQTEYSMLQSFFLFGLFWITLLPFFPMLTMRLFSEEYKMKTIEPLLTAPVREIEVVLAKFFAVVGFYAILFLPLFSYFYFFREVTGVPAADSALAYVSTALIFLLSGMFYLSIGCLASALTRSQILAAVLSFFLVSFFFFLSFLAHVEWDFVTQIEGFINYVSTVQHVRDFSRGIIDTRPILYYLSLTTLVLYATFHVFQYRRWKS